MLEEVVVGFENWEFLNMAIGIWLALEKDSLSQDIKHVMRRVVVRTVVLNGNRLD